jgi:hypothetical protein
MHVADCFVAYFNLWIHYVTKINYLLHINQVFDLRTEPAHTSGELLRMRVLQCHLILRRANLPVINKLSVSRY